MVNCLVRSNIYIDENCLYLWVDWGFSTIQISVKYLKIFFPAPSNAGENCLKLCICMLTY